MNENSNDVQLDVILICKNEIYPTENEMLHFKREIPNNISKEFVIKYMIKEIKQNFWFYDLVIILEKGKVIEIITINDSVFKRGGES